jgi:hypothetical protein
MRVAPGTSNPSFHCAGSAPRGCHPGCGSLRRRRCTQDHGRVGTPMTRRPHRTARARAPISRDIVLAFDPGLRRCLTSLELIVRMAVGVGLVYVFMHVTKVMWIHTPRHGVTPAGAAALVAQHRGITLAAMILAGIIAFQGALSPLDAKPRQLAVTMALMPLPMLLAITVSLQLGSHRDAKIVMAALVVGLGAYARQFVPPYGAACSPLRKRAFPRISVWHPQPRPRHEQPARLGRGGHLARRAHQLRPQDRRQARRRGP